jgi:hypothetical protein
MPGHSVEGGAGAEVLKQFCGTGDISFEDCSVSLPAGSTCSDATPVFRSYASFSQAAAENAYSRTLIGFHFRKSVEEATKYGRQIGKRAADLSLRTDLQADCQILFFARLSFFKTWRCDTRDRPGDRICNQSIERMSSREDNVAKNKN